MQEISIRNRLTRLLDMAVPAGAAIIVTAISPEKWILLAAPSAAVAAAGARFLGSANSRVEQRDPPILIASEAGTAAVELLAALPVPMLLIDAQGIIRVATPDARTLLARQLDGHSVSTVFRSPPVLSAIEEAISGKREDTFGFRIRHPREMSLTATVRPLNGPDDLRAAMILRDETGKVQVDATRSDFVANASHELRTPLAAITGIVETLRGPAKEDPEAQDRFLGIIANQADRMTRLVDDLLSLSRIELQENIAPTERQNLREILAEVLSAMRPIAEESGVALESEIPESIPDVLGSKDELAQIFLNLIDNAIRYGGSLVRVAVAVTAGGIEVSVTDDGPGVERQHIPRLTERFYRVDPSKSRAQGGTGLGLAIVKHIVRRHKGRLLIESEIGQGSRFTVRLPIADNQ